MDSVYSFEERSYNKLPTGQHEADENQQNRVIIVDRFDPNAGWSAPNLARKSSNWLLNCCFARRRSNKYNYDYGPFISNQLLTSKYTLFNFLPKNLFEQFRRLANFYFLTTSILQIILPYSPVGPTTSFIPLMFVITTTAIKQAYEDYLRHKLDNEVNSRVCHVLRNKKLVKIRSEDIKVGDFVYVKNNEEIPCDMMLLATSGNLDQASGDRCYVTTANLDGETSLKPRSCSQIKDLLGGIDQLDQQLLVIECDKPSATLYEFNGFLRAPKSANSYGLLVSGLADNNPSSLSSLNQLKTVSHQQNPSVNSSISSRTTVVKTLLDRIKQTRLNFFSGRSNSGKNSIRSQSESILMNMAGHHEIPLDISNLLLRASRLRNTSFVYGLAIYTGADSKMAKNSQVKPNKFSRTESKVNIYLVVAFAILICFSTISSVFYSRPLRIPQRNLTNHEVFVAHFLLYNYLIPISLYVTLEFIKFFGTISVVEDDKMMTASWVNEKSTLMMNNSTSANVISNTMQSIPSFRKVRLLEKPKCNSSDLNEELGQVEVLFTDKTGTLTDNEMHFTACTTYGSLYRFISDQLYLEVNEKRRNERAPDITQRLSKIKINRYAHIQYEDQQYTVINRNNILNGGKRPVVQGIKSTPFDHRNLPQTSKLRLVDDVDKQERVAEFFMCLCLCSTICINENANLADCLPDRIESNYDFQTASPDEESLIRAAHLSGVTMCKSNDRECYIVIERSTVSRKSPIQMDSQVVDPLESNTTTADMLVENSKSPVSIEETVAQEAGTEFKALIETKNSTSKYIVRHFERLVLFEFNSTRKRMSVIYRDCDNNCLLMVSKGSEDLLDCIRLDDELELSDRLCINITLSYFEAFAKSGLRTLLVARKVLRSCEYEKIVDDMRVARSRLQERDKLLNELYKTFEKDLKLIGSTAVEDTLQEGVPETIENLKLAGIKVWLLTGDKVETAISVAYLSKLLDADTSLFQLVRIPDSTACKRVMDTFRRKLDLFEKLNAVNFYRKTIDNYDKTIVGNFALIIDGRSLYYAMKYQRSEFAKLCKACKVVLGCRLSPLQKAEVVDMMKQDDESPITAAIGDGANDVSMIQEAHVGIGVRGKEGRQAINSSDFAISRFHLLNRLLFVHGHLFYHRTATTIQYFFYKNILFVTPQFIYSFYNFSQVLSLYHPILFVCFNLFFTSLPVLLYGLYERHLPENMMEQHPSLYRINKNNYLMRMSHYFNWLLLGILQGFIGFFCLFYFFEKGVGNDINFMNRTEIMRVFNGPMAKTTSLSNSLGVKLYFVVILTVTVKLYLVSRKHNLYFNLSTLFSCLLLPLILYTYSLLDWTYLLEDGSLYGQVEYYFQTPTFWVAILATTLATIIPDILWYLRNRHHDHRTIKSIINSETITKSMIATQGKSLPI